MNKEKTKQKEYNTTKEKALNSGEIRFHNVASKRFFFNSVRKMDTTRSIEDALAIRSVYYILRRGGRREKGKWRKRGTLAAIFNDASAEKKRKGGKSREMLRNFSFGAVTRSEVTSQRMNRADGAECPCHGL